MDGVMCVEEDEKVIEETKDSNFADAMNKILASSVENKVGSILLVCWIRRIPCWQNGN